MASMKVSKVADNAFMLTNTTSVPYTLRQQGKNPIALAPFSTIRVEGPMKFTVLNMFCGKEKHPEVEFAF